MSNTCWSGSVALADSFREKYPMRAQDMDASARNFIQLTRFLNDKILPFLKKVGAEEPDLANELKALNSKLTLCVRSQYLVPVVETNADDTIYLGVLDKLEPRFQLLERPPGVPANTFNEPI